MAKKQGRFFRTKHKSILGTPYDSLVEKRLHEGVLKNTQFHPEKIDYVSKHTYSPDFTYRDSDGIEWIIEAKSIFNDSSEASKYKSIRDCLKEDQILVFVLEKPEQPIYWSAKRKDGSKQSMEEWCTRNGFLFFTEDTVHRILK